LRFFYITEILNYVSPYNEPSTSKFQNVGTYFSHKTARNEKAMKRNKETKHYVTSKFHYLTTHNVLGLKYYRKCKGNVTYSSIVDYDLNNGFSYHQVLPLTAATAYDG
jgi:DNA polymerase II small subunit/DNA polymerase delta subunit B